MRNLIKDKKGVLGLEVVKSVMVTFLIMGVIAVAIILALVSLRDSNIFSTGSQEENDTTNIINNITEGVGDFFENTPTIFAILVVVVIILAISIIIVTVSRFGGGSGSSGL